MNKTVQPQWLEWAKELQFIAQGGLTYSKDVFDIERFERIREIAAEMLSLQSEIPIEKVKNLFCNETGFQTPTTPGGIAPGETAPGAATRCGNRSEELFPHK